MDHDTDVIYTTTCTFTTMLHSLFTINYTPFSLSPSSRLAKGHLEATVKHVFKNTAAEELVKNYDDFFLNKADDIADQLKMAPGVNDFEAHQMVCEMVQVS